MLTDNLELYITPVGNYITLARGCVTQQDIQQKQQRHMTYKHVYCTCICTYYKYLYNINIIHTEIYSNLHASKIKIFGKFEHL